MTTPIQAGALRIGADAITQRVTGTLNHSTGEYRTHDRLCSYRVEVARNISGRWDYRLSVEIKMLNPAGYAANAKLHTTLDPDGLCDPATAIWTLDLFQPNREYGRYTNRTYLPPDLGDAIVTMYNSTMRYRSHPDWTER